MTDNFEEWRDRLYEAIISRRVEQGSPGIADLRDFVTELGWTYPEGWITRAAMSYAEMGWAKVNRKHNAPDSGIQVFISQGNYVSWQRYRESSATDTRLPAITAKTLLIFGNNTDDGRLVEAVAIPWYEIIRIISQDPESIYEIGPRKWEEIIAGAYERAGFDEVILTPRSGDKGRDVIATKHGIGSVRFLDQIKAYRPGHLVTADEVRSMAGVIALDGNVSKGIITTTSEFAPRLMDDEGIRRIVPYRIELKPRGELLPWLEDLAKK